ncbi:unnamed protein product [Periconia digitata]|uniref:Uncharacterized protein n=1 Tax=Periconia digitata TaxID=1303443 RepID=A0A9W4XNU2_9PLEO|nr:unnamed protein product [Periconia digitata]
MAPIKIGIIGLSSGQSWAVWAHLPYLKNTTKYEIVALCNSSVASAEAAIKAHELSSTIKAYGSYEDLASDPNVELVVCSIRVDKHYEALLPSIKAGKDIFCEWPLAKDAAQADEMLKLAKEKGVKTLVGLQSNQSPTVKKIRELLDSGRIGTLLSTSFHGTSPFFTPTMMESIAYQNDDTSGGNLLTIYGGHSLEGLTHAISPIKSFQSHLATTHPSIQLTTQTGTPTTLQPRTTPDQILLQGTLANNAVFSYHLRGGPAFANSPHAGLVWRLFGTDGEIQVTGPNTFMNIADTTDFRIEVFEHKSGEVEEVVLELDEWSREDGGGVPLFARNIARLYEAFAEGKGEGDGVLGFEQAVERHRFIGEVYEKAGWKR